MMLAKKQMEEAETRRFIEEQKRRKKQDEEDKRRMLELLAKDKEERFGIKVDPNTLMQKKEKDPYEKVEAYFNSIHKLYPSFRNGDKAHLCFKTLGVIVKNILTKDDEKFRKVKMTNPAVQARVGSIPLAVKVLEALKFVDEGEFMVLNEVDKELLSKVQTLAETYAQKSA